MRNTLKNSFIADSSHKDMICTNGYIVMQTSTKSDYECKRSKRLGQSTTNAEYRIDVGCREKVLKDTNLTEQKHQEMEQMNNVLIRIYLLNLHGHSIWGLIWWS
jgi:hypothetical protein